MSRASAASAFSEPNGVYPRSAAPTGISRWLIEAARRHPQSGLRWLSGEDSGAFLAYPALLNEAQRILAGLLNRQIAPGSKIALLLERASDFVPAFWACVLGGYLPCPLTPIRNDPERWTGLLAHLRELLEHPLVITTKSLQPEVSGLQSVLLETLRSGLVADPVQFANYDVPVSPDQPALLVLTSGSTGQSKAAVLTHGNLVASMAGKNRCQQLTADDITLNWISFDHVAALLEAHLLPLYVGANQLHIDSNPLLADPLLFLRLIHEYRVSMTFAPNFLLGKITAQLAVRDQQSEGASLFLDLSCLRHIVSGGEANVVTTGKRFLEMLAPLGLRGSALWPAFGMTETCAGSIYSHDFPHGEHDQQFAALGETIQDLQMRVVSGDGRVLPNGQPGELQLRGPMIFTHYYNNEPATRAAFTTDGWFRTGDLGYIDGSRLRLVGRRKDSIIVSGVNYFSHELESALASLSGIDPAYVAAFPTRAADSDTEQLVIAFSPTFPHDDDARLEQLMIAIRNTTVLLWGFRPTMLLPLQKDAFPSKGSLGKTPRGLLRQLLESGAFRTAVTNVTSLSTRAAEAYSAPQGTTQLAIASIFADIFALDPNSLSATLSFFDLGGTSLEIVRLKTLLRERFPDVDVPLAAMLQNSSVRALATYVTADRSPGVVTTRSYDPLVPLQPNGSKTPLFFIHPASGEVLVFAGLASYFVNDRPCYALRAPGFTPGEQFFATFEEMIETYSTAILRRQPRGPYALAGYSYGGPVAFEIAKSLEARGERVAFLACIDGTPTIGDPATPFDLIDSAVVLAFFLGLIDRAGMQTLPALLRDRFPATDSEQCPQRLAEIGSALLQYASRRRLAELELDLSRFIAWIELSHSLVQHGERHVPTGSVDSLSVFYARPMSGSQDDWLEQRLKQWDRYVSSPVRYLEIEGAHHTIFEPRHLANLQALLRAEIQRALGGL
jgi:acyl-CoA synthetase (AMP-forming)/AMP-acid ligase II/thioesterase domain-containing protein/acyl carrier protein